MIQKLLDEPYWDEIDLIKDFQSFTSFTIDDLIEFFSEDLINASLLGHPYPNSFLTPHLRDFLKTEGFGKLHSHLTKVTILSNKMSFIKGSWIHKERLEGNFDSELEMLTQFLKEERNIQEILDVTSLYILFCNEALYGETK